MPEVKPKKKVMGKEMDDKYLTKLEDLFMMKQIDYRVGISISSRLLERIYDIKEDRRKLNEKKKQV